MKYIHIHETSVCILNDEEMFNFEIILSSLPPPSPESGSLPLSPPLCLPSGSYAPRQRAGAWAWGVGPQGRPLPQTLHSATHQCAPGGELKIVK